MDAYRGITPLERPRLLDSPDPDRNRSWFVKVSIEDYLWHGNAIHKVTVRGSDGWPVAVQWIPAATVTVATEPNGVVHYFDAYGEELPAGDLIHVRRGSDRRNPGRGWGVVEQHLGTLERAALEEDYERNTLAGAGVPSVAIIVPNAALSEDEADDAYTKWMEKFHGPVREPAFLPAGTTITPLGWSPEQSQMVEARKMTLQDVANIFNLDGYWLGAPAGSMTYRSPGPMYVALLRTSLEGVLSDLEQVWGEAWLPRGQSLRFDRLALTRDDFASTITTLKEATEAGLISREEARTYIGLSPTEVPAAPAVTIPSPVDTVPAPEVAIP
jgi:HK97 family phage portal protein